jgi:hypothetical protein
MSDGDQAIDKDWAGQQQQPQELRHHETVDTKQLLSYSLPFEKETGGRNRFCTRG